MNRQANVTQVPCQYHQHWHPRCLQESHALSVESTTAPGSQAPILRNCAHHSHPSIVGHRHDRAL